MGTSMKVSDKMLRKVQVSHKSPRVQITRTLNNKVSKATTRLEIDDFESRTSPSIKTLDQIATEGGPMSMTPASRQLENRFTFEK